MSIINTLSYCVPNTTIQHDPQILSKYYSELRLLGWGIIEESKFNESSNPYHFLHV